MSESPNPERTPVINLKPNQENVHVIVRVLEAGPARVIQTKKGPRTISNAVLGDETGRIKATLWGSKAGSLTTGQVIAINGAWTTVFRGQIQLNIGSKSRISVLENNAVPPEEEIPQKMPRSTQTFQKKSFGKKRGVRGARRG